MSSEYRKRVDELEIAVVNITWKRRDQIDVYVIYLRWVEEIVKYREKENVRVRV